ncbi:hypothetical protein FG152_18045 [Ochrobactrum sp. XJ1]|nr:hypothetical protein [Ochrobactrum sp. XJ1]
MSLFDRSLGIICAVLLLTGAVTVSFGSVFRYGETNVATITNVARHGVELASAHPRCQHPADHSHDILPSLQGDVSSRECAEAGYAAAQDMMRNESGISLVDPPPRA